MKAKKRQSLNRLLEGMREAEELGLNSGENEKVKLAELLESYFKKNDENSGRRRQLLTELNNGAPLTGEKGIRRKLGAFDLEFFGQAYFPHYFSTLSPAFHRELDAMYWQGVMKGIVPETLAAARTIDKQKGCRRAVAAPRGHAKSTNFTFKDNMHAILYQYKHYPIILSDSTEQAEGFLDNIRVEFEENEALIEDFGLLTGKVWRSNVLLTTTGIKIEAIGSGKKIRGRKHRNWRPDLLVLDDVENDENVRTPEQRRKLMNWFTKAVAKAGDWYTDIVLIGTMLHYDSLLANIMKNATYQSVKYKAVLSWATNSELWDEWERIYTDLDNPNHEVDAALFFQKRKEAMLEGTNVLWESKNSYYDLMVQKISDGDAAFNSELQNEPINPEDCIFNEEWFDFYDDKPEQPNFADKAFSFFGFVDPSLGKSKKSDTSAIITLAKHKVTGYMYVLDADITRRHPDAIIADVLEKERWLRNTYKRGYKKFGAETNQFQWFLAEEMKKASARAGLYLPIVEVNQTKDKVMRIQTLQPDVKNKYIKFSRRHKTLLEQMYTFPMGAHDDGPDALEGCRTVAKKTKKFRAAKASDFGV